MMFFSCVAAVLGVIGALYALSAAWGIFKLACACNEPNLSILSGVLVFAALAALWFIWHCAPWQGVH